MLHRHLREGIASIAVAAAFILAAAPIQSRGVAAAESGSSPTLEHPALETFKFTRPTKEEKLASCIALWEPATHMTIGEWKRVCRRIETD